VSMNGMPTRIRATSGIWPPSSMYGNNNFLTSQLLPSKPLQTPASSSNSSYPLLLDLDALKSSCLGLR